MTVIFHRFVREALTLVMAAALFALPAQAVDLPAATSDPVLTITMGDDVYPLDSDGLRALPAVEFTTTTIWTEGPQTFVGLRVTELLERLGVDSGTLTLMAANDYQVDVDVSSFEPDGAILAYDRNGRAMGLRDKGPVWMVYPYDSDSKFRSELIYSNSIWQLDRIIVTR